MVTTDQMIEEATCEVLETTAATRAARVESNGTPPLNLDGLIATLCLIGANGGTLVVYCDREVGSLLTRGMLGLDGEQPDQETINDALGELANQIGGILKRKLGTDGDEIALSLPVVVAGNPLTSRVKSIARPRLVEIQVNNGEVIVCFWPAERKK